MNETCGMCYQLTECFYEFGSTGFRIKLCGTCGGKVMKLIRK